MPFLFPLIALIASPIDELAWLTGSWEGPGIDGAPATEVYSAAAGGQIVGHFRQLDADGNAMFFELITIDEEDGKLRYRLKHFNRDLTGWEEKAQVREFPLTAHIGNRWEFSGLTYERIGEDMMVASVTVSGEGAKKEVLEFRFKRQR